MTKRKEKLRLKMIEWIPELITEWNIRDIKDENKCCESDCSDLIKKITNKIDNFYKKEFFNTLKKKICLKR